MLNPSVKFNDLSLDTKTVFKKVNYTQNTVPELFVKAINKELLFAKNNFEAKYDYVIIEDFEIKKHLKIKNFVFDIGEELIKHLYFSEKLVLFICTAGETISSRNSQLINSDMLLAAYANDIIGNLIVEKTADFILSQVRSQYANTSNRYSPGNCGWNTLTQDNFFSLFDIITSGVSLTESQMMTPAKSLNGLIGIGEKVTFRPNNCAFCDSKNCIYRKGDMGHS